MLRLATWNCRIGGFRYKAKQISRFRPDVLVVQEVEPIDNVLLFGGDCEPTSRDCRRDPAFPRRAIGVFSYSDLELVPVDAEEPMYAFRCLEARRRELAFNVVGVWTSATKSRATSYMQAHEGFRRYGDWIRQRPTVVLGDFNDNVSFKTTNWGRLLELVDPLAWSAPITATSMSRSAPNRVRRISIGASWHRRHTSTTASFRRNGRRGSAESK